MSSTGAGYDLSCTTYSPDGRIYQVEYAQKAVENSGTAIGVRCRDGVVLAVEKALISRMLVKGTGRRIQTVDRHAGVATAGLVADGRQLVNRARMEAQGYRRNYGSTPSPKTLASRMGQFVHQHTCYWYLRPFGASMLLAAYDADERTHELYMTDPTGTTMRFQGCAIGKARQAARTEIEKLKLMDMSCRDALKHIARILHSTHDASKEKPFELEMSWLCEESGWAHVQIPQELRDEASQWAREQIAHAEMDSESDEDANEDV